MEILDSFLYVVFFVIIIAAIGLIIYAILKSPFEYPYYTITFDVSGKRSPDINYLIESYLNSQGIDEFSQHYELVKRWKSDCLKRISESKLKKLRTQQFEEIIDDEHMFRFELIRRQTRYKQINYAKIPYDVNVTIGQYSSNYIEIQNRYKNLASINFECTLSEYAAKEQRKLMTKELREKIALRDNYTCQICGKYMPDGVGLHIDHIISIKKGGKSIPSNLQVLCSKCNGKKSST